MATCMRPVPREGAGILAIRALETLLQTALHLPHVAPHDRSDQRRHDAHHALRLEPGLRRPRGSTSARSAASPGWGTRPAERESVRRVNHVVPIARDSARTRRIASINVGQAAVHAYLSEARRQSTQIAT